MKRPYQITAVVFVLLSAGVARESLELEFYTFLGPGPGFFPFWLALIFASLSMIMLYRATFRESDPMPDGFAASRSGYLRILAITGAMAGTVLLMAPLGFRLTMLLFYIFLLFALGRQNVIVTLLVALAGSFGVYHVFVEGLKVPLPVGVLGI